LAVDGERMMMARNEERAAERRFEPRVAREPTKSVAELSACIELEADTPRAADVVEEPLVRQRAGADEQDIVLVRRREHAGVPRDALRRAADSGFERFRDDLLERRIGDERVREPARIVLVGAGE